MSKTTTSSSLVVVACVATLPRRRLAIAETVPIVLPALAALRAVPQRATIPPMYTIADFEPATFGSQAMPLACMSVGQIM